MYDDDVGGIERGRRWLEKVMQLRCNKQCISDKETRKKQSKGMLIPCLRIHRTHFLWIKVKVMHLDELLAWLSVCLVILPQMCLDF